MSWAVLGLSEVYFAASVLAMVLPLEGVLAMEAFRWEKVEELGSIYSRYLSKRENVYFGLVVLVLLAEEML